MHVQADEANVLRVRKPWNVCFLEGGGEGGRSTWLVMETHTVTVEQSGKPSCGLGHPVGFLWRRRGHELRVWVRWVFPVLCLDSWRTAVHILQEDVLRDGLLDAFTHSWEEKRQAGSYFRAGDMLLHGENMLCILAPAKTNTIKTWTCNWLLTKAQVQLCETTCWSFSEIFGTFNEFKKVVSFFCLLKWKKTTGAEDISQRGILQRRHFKDAASSDPAEDCYDIEDPLNSPEDRVLCSEVFWDYIYILHTPGTPAILRAWCISCSPSLERRKIRDSTLSYFTSAVHQNLNTFLRELSFLNLHS